MKKFFNSLTPYGRLCFMFSIGVFVAAVIGGCGPMGTVTDEQVTKNLHYFQDKRTHLCYAYWKGGAITAVPCEQVTALIENTWSR